MVMTRAGAFVDRDAFSAAGWCSIERALELIGTKSAMLVLREVFYGGRRFDELTRRTGLSDAVVAGRLKQLVDDDVLEQRPYQEPGSRTRQEYFLTDRGRELFALVVAFARWGEGDRDYDQGYGVKLAHAGCGAELGAVVRCAAGHDVEPEDAEAWLTHEHRQAKTTRSRKASR